MVKLLVKIGVSLFERVVTLVLVEVKIVIFIVIELFEAEPCEGGRFDCILIIIYSLNNLIFKAIINGCIIQIVLKLTIDSKPNEIFFMHNILL